MYTTHASYGYKRFNKMLITYIGKIQIKRGEMVNGTRDWC